MKRAPFIGAATAVLLAGCGGNHVMRALPGVAPSSAGKPNSTTGRVVPDAADAIPDNVLNSPIIGEFRRFDGKIPPGGWAFAQGQTLKPAENPHLFSLLGKLTGDGKTVFHLPSPHFPAIIAIAGSFPASPSALASLGRHVSAQDSLGPNAVRAMFRLKSPSPAVAAELAAQRRLAASSIRVGSSRPVPLSRETADRYTQARTDARSTALDALGPNSRARLGAAVEAAVSGRTGVYAVVAEMIASLTNAEADALLNVNDAMIRPFNDRATSGGWADARNAAASFLVSVAFTPEQTRTLRRIERSRV